MMVLKADLEDVLVDIHVDDLRGINLNFANAALQFHLQVTEASPVATVSVIAIVLSLTSLC